MRFVTLGMRGDRVYLRIFYCVCEYLEVGKKTLKQWNKNHRQRKTEGEL